MIINIDNDLFIREHNILNKSDIIKIKKDCDHELKINLCKNVPLYQTHSNLVPRNISKIHWKKLYDKVFLCIKMTQCWESNKKIKLVESWVNKSLSNNNFKFHNHPNDLTCVYILKNKYPEYGTKLSNDIIIEAKENSLLIFNGKITHSITNMPKILANKNPRYSIVMDFNYE
tara:strand:- start:1069 stop:1587 length:519 start_codon:yes stop_codon:yes gene_type:complete